MFAYGKGLQDSRQTTVQCGVYSASEGQQKAEHWQTTIVARDDVQAVRDAYLA